MGASPTRESAEPSALTPKAGRLAVAVSGGRDSVALLHATVRAAARAGLEVWALHVHHGLMTQADDWWSAVQRRCDSWSRRGLPVQFAGERLTGGPSPGQSVEAWARAGRYAALTRMAHGLGIGLVLLAQHRRDQAETVVLQALRAGGPAGLSAMPVAIHREGIVWARPWLDHPREAIEAYVQRHRLRFVDDPSNSDPRWARSRLRNQVWASLTEAFPHAESALAGVAKRMQEAAACNAELAELDLAACADGAGALRVSDWSLLSVARRANVLRHWATRWCPQGVPESLVARLSLEAISARNGSQWPLPGGLIRRESGFLKVHDLPAR